MATFCMCLCVAFLLVFLCLQRSCVANEVNLNHRSRRAWACVPKIQDHQQYYSKQIVMGEIDNYWIELQDESKHLEMSQSPGAAARVNLTFGFPFYGQTINHIFISTAGIITMSPDMETTPVSHSITPYMGIFNPSHSEDSAIYFEDMDDKFVVEWRNVFSHLKVNGTGPAHGPYQFQTIFDSNGTILFLYKKLYSDPAFKSSLIGLHSDINIKKTAINATVDYQGVLVNEGYLCEGSAVIFTPLSICDLAKDSQTCTYEDITFYCKDCELSERCSNETDRHVEQWLMDSCKYETPASCKIPSHGASSMRIPLSIVVAEVLILISVLAG